MLQILTILLSRGNVTMLGEADAFGVIWSFAMKALGVLVFGSQLHHRDVVGVALRRLDKELHSRQSQVLEDVRQEVADGDRRRP